MSQSVHTCVKRYCVGLVAVVGGDGGSRGDDGDGRDGGYGGGGRDGGVGGGYCGGGGVTT